MTVNAILDELKTLGRDNYKKILLTHGIEEPVFGVKIEDLKKIQKRVKKNHELALGLYDTGVYDAMYLAGLIADESRMTKKDLQRWLDKATCEALCDFTVAKIAAETKHGRELALKWIDSKKDAVAAAGWTTLSSVVSVTDDADLDMAELKKLLQRMCKSIHQAPNSVRYAMNCFVISVGCYVKPLSELALEMAEKIGVVDVELATKGCKVPYAPDYIRKVHERGSVGNKRKKARC